LVQITQDANTWRLSGDFTVNNMNIALDLSRNLIMPNQLDFSGVTEVDTSAISFIFEMQRRAKAQKTQMAAINLPANLRTLMQLYGVETFVL
jgi:phospholipid transport system transporter-binding protein